tara:strand:- start:1653 stop:7790 length:6138 start_codon:yes stop_codon:yes gene_type:complete
MAETPQQTFSDETVPPKEPKAALTLEERAEKVLGYKPKTLESRRKIEQKAAREASRSTGIANLPKVQASLNTLVSLYGTDLKIQTPQEMATYLRKEALKDGPLPRILNTPEASNFFSNAARSEFAYEPRANTPIYSLDAYREGYKRNQKEQEESAQLMQEAFREGEQPDLNFVGLVGDQPINIPRMQVESDAQKQVFDQLNVDLSGGALGNMFGASFTPDDIALQQQAYGVSDADLKAMGEENYAEQLKKARDLTISSDSKFEGRKFRPSQMFIHLMDVSGKGKNAINLQNHRRDFRIGFKDMAAHEAGFPSFAEWAASKQLTDEMREKVNAEADEKAVAKVKRIQQQSRPGTIFIDDPDKLVRAVRKGEDPLAYTSIPVNIASGLKNLGVMSEETYDAFLRQRGPWAAIWYPPSMRQFNMGTLTYAEQVEDINPGTFQQIMNIGPLRVLGSWMLSDDPDMMYGSSDHLRNMLQFDWGQNIGKVGEKAVELTGTEGTRVEKLTSTLASTLGIGAMFFEPDVITLATLPVGFVGKGGKLATKAAAKAATGTEVIADAAAVYKLRQYDRLLEEAEKKLADGTFTESTQVMNLFKENNAPELAAMYDTSLMADVAGSIRVGTTGKRDYSPRFDGITSRLEETRKQIKKLEADVSDQVEEYIKQYGVVPKDADDAALKLLRKKQEESILESGQAYASFAAEQEKLSQLAQQRGIGLEDLTRRGKGQSPDFFDQEILEVVREGREALTNLQRLEARYADRLNYRSILQGLQDSGKKLTKRQAKELEKMPQVLADFKKQIRETQELVRDRWADGALAAQYKKYQAAQDAYEESVVAGSKYFTREVASVEGIPFEAAKRLRDSYAQRAAARVKANKDLKNARRNLKRATTDTTKKKWEKIIDELEEGAEVRRLDEQFQASLESYIKSEKDLPSLEKIGLKSFKKMGQEIKEGVINNRFAHMQNALKSIRGSVTKYDELLKTKQIDEAPLIAENTTLFKVDPNDPTQVLVNQSDFTKAFDKRYGRISDPDNANSPAFKKFVDEVNRVFDNTFTAQSLKKLADAELTYKANKLAEKESVTSLAQGLIRSWSQPPALKQIFSQIDSTNPSTWLDMGLRSSFRLSRNVRRYFDPQAHRFGDFDKNALNSAQIAVTKQQRANEELTLLSDQWVRQGDNYVENVSRYLTSNEAYFIRFRGQRVETSEGLGVGIPAIMNQGEKTPWKQFKEYILGLDDAQAALALRATAFAYLGRGVEAGSEFNKFSDDIIGIAIDELKRLDDLADTYSDAEQLSMYVKKIQEQTKKFGGIDPDASRTFAFVAKGVLHGAVMNGFLTDLVRSGGIAMTAKQALSANTILGQVKATVGYDAAKGKNVAKVKSEAPGAEAGFSPAEGFKALEQYGMSMDDARFGSILRNLQGLEELSGILISTNRMSDASKASFVPQALIRRIEEEAGKISKQLAATSAPDSMVRKALSATGTYLRAWRTNILFGSVMPRATYFTNQFSGDLSQLHTFEGTISIRRVQLGKHKGKLYTSGAAPLMFQNAFTYTPYWGNWIQDYLITRTKDATRAGRRNVLTTPLQAFLNPYITELMRMSDELMETKEGFRSGAQFMEEALEDGVLDTLMTDDLYRMLDDARKLNEGTVGARIDQVLTGVDNFSSNWTNMVTTTQARQRLALYAEYRLMRGESRTAAKAAVLDALYDWRHGVTDWEMATIGQVIAFYPFFRLGAKQFQRAALEGLTNPSLDMAKRALVGRTKLARMRNQGRLVYSVANYVFNDDVDQAMNEAEMQHEIYRRMRPWWIGSRPAPSNNLMPKNDQVEFRKAGRKETYYTTVFPMWTALDMADLHLKFFNGIAGAMLYYGNSGQVRPSYDAAKTINKTLADFSHPIFKAATSSALEFGFDVETGYRSPKGTRLRLGEVGAYKAYSKVPFLGSMINMRPDEKGYYVSNRTADVIRGIPVLGTDIPNFWRDFGPTSMGGGNPKWASQSTAAMAFYLRNWTSIGRQIPFDPKEALFRDRQQRVADFKKEAKSFREISASRGAPEEARINKLEFDEDEK